MSDRPITIDKAIDLLEEIRDAHVEQNVTQCCIAIEKWQRAARKILAPPGADQLLRYALRYHLFGEAGAILSNNGFARHVVELKDALERAEREAKERG